MPKTASTHLPKTGSTLVKKVHGFSEYKLANNLTFLYKEIPGTKVVTTNIVYKAGSIDEDNGETGVAHMLEHMMFKPTLYDKKRKQKESAVINFEQETGINLNASTWRDRTNYHFTMGSDHLNRALSIEAERMRGLVLDDKEFQPERSNVLSEYDMYNSQPEFALSAAMQAAAFVSHPYRHETIGWREDIANYKINTLKNFYDRFYRPDNAVLIICGDVKENIALEAVINTLGQIKAPNIPLIHRQIIEPKQEGERRVTVKRPGTVNLWSVGVKHQGLPHSAWYETLALFEILAGGPESWLYRHLVDTGLVSSINYSIEPTRETNLATITLTLSETTTAQKVESKFFDLIKRLDQIELKRKLPAQIAKLEYEEIKTKDSSYELATVLTEFVTNGNWTSYFDTVSQIKSLTAAKVDNRKKLLFAEHNLTIGNFASQP